MNPGSLAASEHEALKSYRFRHDALLVLTIGAVAACGLIYEYLMAHYAGRILGVLESTIYAMIGLMITAMGLGAFCAKWITSIYRGFAWLELAIGMLGVSAVLILSGGIALTYSLPEAIRTVYGLDESIRLGGGLVQVLEVTSKVLPFLLGAIIGFLVGMEIPLIARIRENIHQQHLEHNLGTMYGADYIGAGIGAAIWVVVCLKIPIIYAAVGTASLNAFIGIVFLVIYRKQIGSALSLWIGHAFLVMLLVVMALYGSQWMTQLTHTLFADKVVHELNTPYQSLVLTKRHISKSKPSVLSLYINGRLQFASNDEHIYHSYLTAPVLFSANNPKRILVLGGGDGLAVRDVLHWNDIEAVTLIDIDKAMLDLFKGIDSTAPDWLSQDLVRLNENSLNDPRVELIVADAFIEIERMIDRGVQFDAIIVDLPDPSHPDLNRLYSDFFYARLKQVLSPDGAIVVQSTSPFHAENAFFSVGRTLEQAGFKAERYHANVPSFGEWGWSIGVVQGAPPSQRIANHPQSIDPMGMLAKPQMLAAFVFPVGYLKKAESVQVNELGSHILYNYHQEAWQTGFGLYYAIPESATPEK